jgi:hypothetical protein
LRGNLIGKYIEFNAHIKRERQRRPEPATDSHAGTILANPAGF